MEYQGLSPEQIATAYPTVSDSSDTSDFEVEETTIEEHGIEEREPPKNEKTQGELQEIDQDPPSTAAEVPPHEIDQGPPPIKQRTEPDERVETMPGGSVPKRPVRNRRPPSTLNCASLGNPYVSNLQASNHNVYQPHRQCSTFLPLHSFHLHIFLPHSPQIHFFSGSPQFTTTQVPCIVEQHILSLSWR